MLDRSRVSDGRQKPSGEFWLKARQMGNVGSKPRTGGIANARMSASWPASCAPVGQMVGQPTEISAGGAKVDVDQPIEAYTAITFSIDHLGDYGGEIVWSSGGAIGGKFSEDP
jgi:hypothetical protein